MKASGSPGAGSLEAVSHIEPVGVATCVFHADVIGSMRYANGRPDGRPVTARVDWLLPQTVAWMAGGACFNRTEILAVQAGDAHDSEIFPGGDCSTASAGRAGSEHHALSPPAS
jgi:hypothetical protein